MFIVGWYFAQVKYLKLETLSLLLLVSGGNFWGSLQTIDMYCAVQEGLVHIIHITSVWLTITCTCNVHLLCLQIKHICVQCRLHVTLVSLWRAHYEYINPLGTSHMWNCLHVLVKSISLGTLSKFALVIHEIQWCLMNNINFIHNRKSVYHKSVIKPLYSKKKP